MRLRRCVLTALLGFANVVAEGPLLGADPPARPETGRVLSTPSGVRYGVWPEAPKRPAPTLFILASTIEETLDSAYFRQAGNVLAERGYVCVSIDLPCHGPEKRADELEGLRGWRGRCEKGEDFVAEVTARFRAVLDHLIAQGYTDPDRVAACGTSRGGFLAMHVAAAEPRLKCVAAFAPLIDMGVLTEFRGAERMPMVERLSLDRRASALAGRALWLVIGDRDERVGTDRIIQFARLVTSESLRQSRPALVDLHVVAEPKGHTTPPGSAERAAEWIDAQLGRTQ